MLNEPEVLGFSYLIHVLKDSGPVIAYTASDIKCTTFLRHRSVQLQTPILSFISFSSPPTFLSKLKPTYFNHGCYWSLFPIEKLSLGLT